MKIDTLNIPTTLRASPQWVLWRREQRNGKETKVPYRVDGRRASSTNSQTWVPFETALSTHKKGSFDGLGFVVTPADNFSGIDLDHCVDPLTGEIDAWAREIVDRLDSYTEVTPSGTGLRIFVFAKLPTKDRKLGNAEMYDSGRFLTITGKHLKGTPLEVRQRQEEMEAVHTDVFASRNTRAESTHPPPNAGVSSDDQELIQRAISASNGSKFVQLLQGDTTGYASQSEAELAFCSLLAFWTGGDPGRIDRLFRQSGLSRAKWDERHGALTYGQMTINKALERSEFYQSDSNGHYQEPPEINSTQQAAQRQSFNLTDLGNAKRMVVQHGHDIHYCYIWGKWLTWEGMRWKVDDSGEIYRRAKETVASIYREAAALAAQAAQDTDEERRKDLSSRAESVGKWARKSESRARIEAIVALAESEPDIPVTPAQLDSDPWLLNTKTGTVDLPTGKLREHQREDLITHLAPVEYDAGATSDTWLKFLDRVLPNQELQGFVKRAIGYSLTGSTNEEKLFFPVGPSATGKSTFLRAISATLGDYAATADFGTFLAHDHSDRGPTSDIARLAGRRFVMSVEVDNGKKLAEGLTKQLTGGDVVSARFLYRESFEFSPSFKLWLASNDRPRVRDDDTAMWRRILQIPFDQQIPEEERDPSIKTYLSDPDLAGPAVLAWAVQGCLDWQTLGLGVPEAVKAATREYRQSMDPLTDFIQECCVLLPDAKASNPDLWGAYQDWCKDNSIKYSIGRKSFTQRLEAKDCKIVPNSGKRIWVGIGLIDERVTI